MGGYVDRRLWVPSAAVVVAAVIAGIAVGRPQAPTAMLSPILATVTTAPAVLTVHVSGSVVEPGLVTVADGARVADAVAAAGGATQDADLGALNLAEPVSDGARLRVPQIGESAADLAPGGPSDGFVSINRATVAELQALPGVGPVLAQRIIDHRESIGGFTVIEDLLDVPGIGERILAGMRDLIVVP